MVGLIVLLIVGLLAGLIARALVPGKDAMGCLATIVLGVVGSFVGGAINAIFTDNQILDFNASGLILSIIGAVVALLIYNALGGRRRRHG